MKDKLKAKLKSYGFWVSLASAVMVFLNTLGLKVDIPYLSQVTTAFLSILVIAGILTKPGDSGSGSAEDGAEDTEEETAEDGGPWPYTRGFMRMLEHTIRRQPAYWLWSHRRWSGARPPGPAAGSTPR